MPVLQRGVDSALITFVIQDGYFHPVATSLNFDHFLSLGSSGDYRAMNSRLVTYVDAAISDDELPKTQFSGKARSIVMPDMRKSYGADFKSQVA